MLLRSLVLYALGEGVGGGGWGHDGWEVEGPGGGYGSAGSGMSGGL